MKIDLKDKKILFELDFNCRQSNTQIGKKVGLSRKVVEYRIKKMEEDGMITGYWSIIDSFRLGYNVYRYYIIFQNANRDIKKEIIHFLIKYKNIWTVYSAIGSYDLGIVIWVNDVHEFYNFWQKFNDTYGDYILDKYFSIYLQSESYSKTCLIPNNYDNKDREKFTTVGPGSKIIIDYLDYRLLCNLSTNAKKPIIDIAKEINCSSQSINYRIKNLINKRIIKQFRVSINNSLLNMQDYIIAIWLRKLAKRKEILKYFRYNPYVTYINTSAGYADFQIEMVVKNLEFLNNIMEELLDKYPEVIHKYDYLTVKNQHIINCLPDLTEKDFK